MSRYPEFTNAELMLHNGQMKAYFSAQPWEGGRNVGDFLTDATGFATPDSRLRIAVAWTRASGIALAEPHFEKVISAGGTVDLITGLSAGGATRQGLERALEVCSSVHVVFDLTGPTFHPKLYMYRGEPMSRLLVGSSNLTAGGYFRNVEAGVTVEASDDEGEIFDEVDDWLDDLIADAALTLPLTHDLLAQLVADPRYKIGDETERAGAGSTTGPLPPAPGHFSKSSRKRRYAVLTPKSGGSPAVVVEEDVVSTPPTSPPYSTPPSLLRVWSKRLSDSDALRPPDPNSKVTGALRLGKSVFPIDKNTFFMNELFSSVDWAEDGGKLVTVVPFHTIINGVDHGIYALKIDFFESRISDQNNVPTVLHWGALTPTLRSGDYRNHWVVLRSLSDGSFELEIKPTPDTADLPPED